MRHTLSIAFLLASIDLVFSQDKQTQNEAKSSPFTVSGYVDVFYGFDFNKPNDNTRPAFMYSYNRHNETNLNLGFVKAAYNNESVRANLALMAGTYANANLASEPGVLKNIFEANAGVKISSKHNLWIDAGIFASHIGFESAISKDCWNLTRSILADNSPYYESGAKISYTSESGEWFLSALWLNGWQRIHRVDGNSLPSFGTQVTFKPNDKVTLNSSTFVGTDKPDSARQMRYFHNFYGIFQVAPRLGITVGLDYGLEERSPETSAMSSWWSPVVIVKYTVSEKAAVAMRGEYYDDGDGVIVATGTPNGFRTTGVSANFDYQILQNAVWRLEARSFSSRDAVFQKENGTSKSNTFITTSLAVSF